MNQRIRQWIMDCTAWALNWVWDHILRDAPDGGLLDSFGWWLDARLGHLFAIACNGSDFELWLAEDGAIDYRYLNDRQRAHLAALNRYPRYCTPQESDSLHDCLCPVCGTATLLEGPHGGLCVNVMCSRCRSKWNIAPIEWTCEALDPPLALSVPFVPSTT